MVLLILFIPKLIADHGRLQYVAILGSINSFLGEFVEERLVNVCVSCSDTALQRSHVPYIASDMERDTHGTIRALGPFVVFRISLNIADLPKKKLPW